MSWTSLDWDAAAIATACREAQEARRDAAVLCRAAARTRASVAVLLDQIRETQSAARRLVGERTETGSTRAVSVAPGAPAAEANRADPGTVVGPAAPGPRSATAAPAEPRTAATSCRDPSGSHAAAPEAARSSHGGAEPAPPFAAFGQEDLDDVVNGLIAAYQEADAVDDAEARRRYGELLVWIGQALAEHLGPRASGLILN